MMTVPKENLAGKISAQLWKSAAMANKRKGDNQWEER